MHAVGITVDKLEYHPPVATHLYSPLSLPVAFERVKMPTRYVHILDAERGVNGLQSLLNSRFMDGLNGGCTPAGFVLSPLR